MKLLIKVFKLIFDFIILLSVVLVICVMYNFFQVVVLNKDYPELFGYTFFEVTTGSMKDAININDVVIVKITKDVNKNDIISFFNDDKMIITHRVIEAKKDFLTTKGDANNSEDNPISRDVVIGKVETIIPKLGVWIKVFLDYRVMGAIIITFFLFGLALSDNKKKKSRHSFSKFLKNVKGNLENAKKAKTKD